MSNQKLRFLRNREPFIKEAAEIIAGTFDLDTMLDLLKALMAFLLWISAVAFLPINLLIVLPIRRLNIRIRRRYFAVGFTYWVWDEELEKGFDGKSKEWDFVKYKKPGGIAKYIFKS